MAHHSPDHPRTPPEARSAPPAATADATGFWSVPAAIRRVSWGAIFAGVIVALTVQLVLNLLGFGVGMLAFQPATEAQPLAGFGTGTIIWLIVSGIIGLFLGGWVAGRLAGIPRSFDGMLHGVVTWCAATLITFLLLTTAVGRIIGGTAWIIGQGLTLAGEGIAAAAPAVGEEVGPVLREELERQGILQEIRRTVSEAATAAMQDPQAAEQEVEQAVERLFTRVADQADREAVVAVLVRRTDMSEAEARQAVGRWEEAIADARTQVDTLAARVGEQAPATAERVTADVGRAAIWTFVVLLFGAAAAAVGGFVAAPKDLPAEAAGGSGGARRA